MLTATETVSSCAATGPAPATSSVNAATTAFICSRVANTTNARSRRSRGLLEPSEEPVDEKDQQQEEDRERDRDVEVALAGLEHHRRRQRARLTLDVAADHHRCADLRDDAAEACHHRGEHRETRLLQHPPHHL